MKNSPRYFFATCKRPVKALATHLFPFYHFLFLALLFFFFSLLLYFFTSFHSFSQTTLPAGWGFNGTPPNGWTISGTDIYTSSGFYIVSPGGKFDNTGDYMQIFFSDAPGALTYYLRGSSFSGGTFSVQQSTDGSSWNNLRVFTAPSNSMTEYADTPSYSARYIRFYYTQKASGNIAVDEVNLAIAPLTNAPEIDVKQNGSAIFSGITYPISSPVGVSTPFTFSVENLGLLDTLFLNTPSISGTNASEFTVSSFPTFVLPLTSENFTVNFLPQQAGTRIAALSFTNSDADESPFVINFYGVGGSLAEEPTAQPSNISFNNVKSYRFKVQFSVASPAPEGYIVLRKKGSPITDVPTDGKGYLQGDTVGNSQVAYAGSGTSFYPNNIIASNDYYFVVFSYNGPAQYRNYLGANPLTGNITSSGNMMGGYYTGINVTNSTFITDLHNRIYPHFQVFYSNYINTNINLFASRDTAGGKKVVTCVYSGENYVYTSPFTFDTYSREHTYCHSWMPTNPADNPERKEYDDQHHLFPSNLDKANQKRLNYPLGIVANITYTYMEGKLGTDASGQIVYEPRDAHKGDAARALFYMCAAYHTVDGYNWFLPPYQSQTVLKQWHFQDPPDNWEITRNDFLDSLQGNRNPFVDSAHFACYIDFYTMTKITNPPPPCYPLGIANSDANNDEIIIYPNPNDGEFQLSVTGNQSSVGIIKIYNILGEEIYRLPITGYRPDNHREPIVLKQPCGIYNVQIQTQNKLFIKKIVIE